MTSLSIHHDDVIDYDVSWKKRTCPFELLKNIFAKSHSFGVSFGVQIGFSDFFLFDQNWIAYFMIEKTVPNKSGHWMAQESSNHFLVAWDVHHRHNEEVNMEHMNNFEF